jgi:outer membrane protein OmpA-like peptidoglycan-associated protein
MTILYIRPENPGKGGGKTRPKAENENENKKNRREETTIRRFG